MSRHDLDGLLMVRRGPPPNAYAASLLAMDSDVPFEMQHNPCHDTVAGWLWYCDEHDSHGTADSEEEARFVAAAHREFHEPDDDSDDTCCLIITKVETAPDA